jgi:hypothetical protein
VLLTKQSHIHRPCTAGDTGEQGVTERVSTSCRAVEGVNESYADGERGEREREGGGGGQG